MPYRFIFIGTLACIPFLCLYPSFRKGPICISIPNPWLSSFLDWVAGMVSAWLSQLYTHFAFQILHIYFHSMSYRLFSTHLQGLPWLLAYFTGYCCHTHFTNQTSCSNLLLLVCLTSGGGRRGYYV